MSVIDEVAKTVFIVKREVYSPGVVDYDLICGCYSSRELCEANLWRYGDHTTMFVHEYDLDNGIQYPIQYSVSQEYKLV